MKVYISWSGSRSRAVAKVLREFIPTMLQAAHVYTSADDIEPGARWSAEVEQAFHGVDVGVLCITPENLQSPWMLFEAGALSRTTPHIVPLLLDISPNELVGPLVQFQALSLSRSDIYQFLRSLNGRLERALADETFDRLFDHLWPSFENKIQSVREENNLPVDTADVHRRPSRSDHEMLAEVLQIVRRLGASDTSQDT
jgi:hypothetical protein